jgi:flagellar motility protein MotE (MotC chaperone)
MTFSRHIRILPALVIVALLSLTIRLGDFFYGLDNAGTAHAQQESTMEPPPLPEAGTTEMSAEPAELPAGNIPEAKEPVEWQDATEADIEYSNVKSELYEDLAKRREELDSRERQLSTREALLSAAERELEQKLREMTTIKNEIELLLSEQSEEEQARVNSLVKIYEGMKSKDAARIFNTLDMDVLILVMSRMSERKSAPILAEMNPERARTVTILLAQQKQLPTLSSQ